MNGPWTGSAIGEKVADPVGARRTVSSSYLAASLGYPAPVDGGFWWCFATEMQPPGGDALAATVATVGDAITG